MDLFTKRPQSKTHFLHFFWLYVFAFLFAPVRQTKAYTKDTLLWLTPIGLNAPYIVQCFAGKNTPLKDKLFYKGDTLDAVWNHSLNLINVLTLVPELPFQHLLLATGTFIGVQTLTYTLFDSYGVSLIWSGLGGMILQRLTIQKEIKWYLILATLLNTASLAYYAHKLPMVSTGAHLGGIALGFGFSFLLPYKKSGVS